MSMETHVFFRGKLPTKAALSRAMRELGFPFSISPSTGSLERQSGFMPMKRRGEVTGVVFDEAEDKLLSADDAITLARKNLRELIKPEDAKHPGTRPADLKRYL